MQLFTLLNSIDPAVTPKHTKIHLAGFNQVQQPLDVYRDSVARWENWQAHQSRRNFERPYVVSLIDLPRQPELWLFVGVYHRAQAPQKRTGPEGNWWHYDLARIDAFDDLAARLVVKHHRSDRTSYCVGERVAPELQVHELRPCALGVAPFPGYKQVHLSFSELRALVNDKHDSSWRTALSAVSGVYVVTDRRDGKLYVGSASGEQGIWGRWSQYLDGHAGNKRLKELVGEEKARRAESFCFAILETADTSATWKEILAREEHWKRVLLSRQFGNN